jgi:hypothetical protein
MDHSLPGATATFESQMTVVLDRNNRVPLPVVLKYDATDPFAVSATFRTGEGDITWVFGRDLLRSGLTNAVGQGDIMIRPAHPSRGPVVHITLSSPNGAAKLEGNRHELHKFLKQVYDIVPDGHEWQYLQVDRVIGELLADG